MSDLERISEDIAMRMKELENARIAAINGSRLVIRSTKTVIHSIQVQHLDTQSVCIMDEQMKELVLSVNSEPEILHSGIVEDAMMEYAEAKIFISMIYDLPIQSYGELGISPQSWVMGLCDAIGELRRLLLTYLMSSDLQRAQGVFSKMEEACDTIMIFDVPDAIAPIRRKQDTARSIMEKTRSDMTSATMILKIHR